MADRPSLNELVERWQQTRQRKEAVSWHELCADCPDMIDELRRRVEAVASTEGFLGLGSQKPGARPQPGAAVQPYPLGDPKASEPPVGPPVAPEVDRNLLFGILALQMDFVSRDALIAGMNAWVLDKRKSLGQVLREQGMLHREEQALLDALVGRHLQKHGGDPAKSLAAVSSVGSLRDQLRQVADPDVQASLAHVSTGQETREDACATRPPAEVGAPTSAGWRFRILRPHARGGLGQVYVARDEELHREVALKEIQQRYADHPESRARFVLEAEVTGRLEHPGVVPVYGLGTYSDGRPFYAMRFIKGDSLQDAVKRFHEADKPDRDPGERQLELRKLLGRFLDVCNAVAYAHSRGVLHRDLKPGNVMLGPYGETLVVDWGLAKVLGRKESNGDSAETTLRPKLSSDSAETVAGSQLGTPAYMSPEQAEGRIEELGPASDVYSLGATLYCLLTGQAAFQGDSVEEVLGKVRRGDFPPPRHVKPALLPALEAVCLKAMALRPRDRYATPRLLADDLEHWLADEPVAAYRERLPARLRRRIRQHKVLATAAAAAGTVAATITVALLLITTARSREQEEQRLREAAEAQQARAEEQQQLAEQSRAEAERQRARAERFLYPSHLDLAHREWQEARIPRVLELLEEHRPKGPGQEDLRGFEWHYLWRLCHGDLHTLPGHTGGLQCLAFSPDGRRLVTGAQDGGVKVWDVHSGREARALDERLDRVLRAAFTPDGRPLIVGTQNDRLNVWDVDGGRETALPVRYPLGDPPAVAFSPDAGRLAVGGRAGTVNLCDPRSGRTLQTFSHPSLSAASLAFSPDGGRLAVGSSARVTVWDAARGQELLSLAPDQGGTIQSVAFSPDGKRLASGGEQGVVKVWDLQKGEELLTLTTGVGGVALPAAGKAHADAVHDLAFSPDGKWLATASRDRTARVWDARTGRELLVLKGHAGPVPCVAFSPNAPRLATGSWDRTVKIWDTSLAQAIRTPHGHARAVQSVSFSPDGRRFASGGWGPALKVWDAQRGQELLRPLGHIGPVSSVAFTPDARRILSGGDDKTLRVWDADSGKELLRCEGHKGVVHSIAVSPDGRRALSGSYDNTVRLWDLETGQELRHFEGHTNDVYAVAFSPDGRLLASASGDAGPAGRDRPNLWDAAPESDAQQALQQLLLAATPDRERASTVRTESPTVKVWDSQSGKEVWVFREEAASQTSSLGFSADGKRLACGRADGTVKVWNVQTGQEEAVLEGHAFAVRSVAFSSDGRRLASGGADRTVKVWDVQGGQELITLKAPTAVVRSVAFSPDGMRLACGCEDGSVKVWDAVPLAPEIILERDAAALVEPLFVSLVHRADVLDYLRRQDSLGEPLLRQALAHAEGYRPDPEVLDAASWRVVAQPNASAEAYQRALRQAEEACRLDPQNGDYLNTLGVARYRTGRYSEAVETLLHSVAAHAARPEGVLPHDLAFLAMAHHRLGQAKDAREYLQRLRESVQRDSWAGAAEAREFLGEAEALLGK